MQYNNTVNDVETNRYCDRKLGYHLVVSGQHMAHVPFPNKHSVQLNDIQEKFSFGNFWTLG